MPELQPLSPFEQRVVAAARDGEVADFSSADDAHDDLAKWLKDREIRAQLIYALATNSNPNWPVHAKGVRVKGALIVGALDFEAANVKCPLSLEQCWIPEQMIFTHASVSALDLSGSFVRRGINADGMRADHDVVLAEGFVAKGAVSLRYATLGGVLYCDGGSFVNETGNALSADRIDVKGSVFLRNDFSAKGGVRLVGAKIGGNLECDASSFENPTEYALSADRIDVTGGIFLRSRFGANGGVRLLGGKVGGNLDCNAGSFVNDAGDALSADGIDVRGNIFLRSGFSAKGKVRFSAKGEVRFLGAKVGGTLDCSEGSFEKGSFENATGKALSADGIDVKGSILLRSDFSAKGEVRLLGANVGGDLECSKGSFENASGAALCADGSHVTGGLFMLQGFSASGAVNLLVPMLAHWSMTSRAGPRSSGWTDSPTTRFTARPTRANASSGSSSSRTRSFGRNRTNSWPACCAGWAMSATPEKSLSRSRSRYAIAANWAAPDGFGAGCCGRPSATATDSGGLSRARPLCCCWGPSRRATPMDAAICGSIPLPGRASKRWVAAGSWTNYFTQPSTRSARRCPRRSPI